MCLARVFHYRFLYVMTNMQIFLFFWDKKNKYRNHFATNYRSNLHVEFTLKKKKKNINQLS